MCCVLLLHSLMPNGILEFKIVKTVSFREKQTCIQILTPLLVTVIYLQAELLNISDALISKTEITAPSSAFRVKSKLRFSPLIHKLSDAGRINYPTRLNLT